jgi:hypothetical protein
MHFKCHTYKCNDVVKMRPPACSEWLKRKRRRKKPKKARSLNPVFYNQTKSKRKQIHCHLSSVLSFFTVPVNLATNCMKKKETKNNMAHKNTVPAKNRRTKNQQISLPTYTLCMMISVHDS